MLLPLTFPFMWSLNPFPLHTQGWTHAYHSRALGTVLFLTQPNCADLFAVRFPRLSLQLHSWNCTPSGTAHLTLTLIGIKAFWYLSCQPKLMTGWEKFPLTPFPPVCYMLTGNQLGNHREKEYNCARERKMEGSTFPSLDSVSWHITWLIQPPRTATMHHFLFILSEKSSKVPMSFSPSWDRFCSTTEILWYHSHDRLIICLVLY